MDRSQTNAKRREYYAKNRERILTRQQEIYAPRYRDHKLALARDRDLEQKLVVLDYYSHGTLMCAHCSIDDPDVLTIDHINGGGRQERLREGTKTYRFLINQGFPEGFQVLCFNCNWKKRLNQD